MVKLYEREDEEAKSKHKREILQNASSLLQYSIYLVTRTKRIKNEIKLYFSVLNSLTLNNKAKTLLKWNKTNFLFLSLFCSVLSLSLAVITCKSVSFKTWFDGSNAVRMVFSSRLICTLHFSPSLSFSLLDETLNE